eukprot:3781486-Pyramimonas_sp.AAC.1
MNLRGCSITNKREASRHVEEAHAFNSPKARSPKVGASAATRRNEFHFADSNISHGVAPQTYPDALSCLHWYLQQLPPLSPWNKTKDSEFSETDMSKAREFQKLLRR